MAIYLAVIWTKQKNKQIIMEFGGSSASSVSHTYKKIGVLVKKDIDMSKLIDRLSQEILLFQDSTP